MSVKYILFVLFMLTRHNKTETPKLVKLSSNNPRIFATCVENIGCIDTNEKWYDDRYRSINLEPLSRHTIRTEFLLLKRGSNSSKEILYDILTLRPESVNISAFKDGINTIFLIHDFTSNGHTGWVKHITIALNDKIESNVISVDWEAGAEPPFDQAIANARVVALEIKVFIEMLKNSFSLKEQSIHMIGHGVGAHIAGYVGKSLPGIGRITGLDPTGPRFENMPPAVRLDVGDALYVEVLHTDAFNGRSQGTKEPMGHADFYFNNAERQPGCEENTSLPKFSDVRRDAIKEGMILPACSHKRSFKYYIHAIVGSDCRFVGISCSSYDSFLIGNCTYCGNSECATFGLTEPAGNVKHKRYFLVTDSEPPFCLHTYVVNVTVDNNLRAKSLEGSFEFIFVDEDKKVTNATGYLDKATRRTFIPGQTYTLVVYTSPPKIGKIKEGKVKWLHNKKLLETFSSTSIFINQLSVKRVPYADEESTTSILCPVLSNEIKNKDFIEFALCSNVIAANTGNAGSCGSTGSAIVNITPSKKYIVSNKSTLTAATTSGAKLSTLFTLHATSRTTTTSYKQLISATSAMLHKCTTNSSIGASKNTKIPEYEHVKTIPYTKETNLEASDTYKTQYDNSVR